MFFNFCRSKPKFQLGQLTFLPDDTVRYKENRYLLIERQRWVKKKWFYDGNIFHIKGDKLFFYTTVTGQPEEEIAPFLLLKFGESQ